jgi:very-short-patch-repair endonuclease
MNSHSLRVSPEWLDAYNKRHNAKPRVSREVVDQTVRGVNALKKEEARARREALEARLLRDMRAIGLPAPTREFKFHPTRKYRFDFAWDAYKLAVECDGGTGRVLAHNSPKGYQYDCERDAEASILGWTVLRFTGNQIKNGSAVTFVERWMKARGFA